MAGFDLKRHSVEEAYFNVNVEVAKKNNIEVGVEGGLRRFYFGALLQIGQESLGHVKELVEVAAGAVLQVEGETVGGTVTGNHRRLEEEHLRILEHIA